MPNGSSMSALFGNLVLEDLAIECLNRLKQKYNCEPKCYFRYVNDTFLCIQKRDFDHGFKVFNEYDSNIKFTHQMELNEKINFLDVTISRTNNVISTNWYQKSIASDRVLLFTSNYTVQQKRNMVYSRQGFSIVG